MSRPVDRLLGRDATQQTSFGTRPFGTTPEEASAQATSAASATGASAGPNMTTGTGISAATAARAGAQIP